MKNKTKLSVFDFDGTLIATPLPDSGKIAYEEKTGKTWPHKGWWGQADSLDMNVFDIQPNPDVVNDFKKEEDNAFAWIHYIESNNLYFEYLNLSCKFMNRIKMYDYLMQKMWH